MEIVIVLSKRYLGIPQLIYIRVELNDLDRLSEFICLTVYMLTLILAKKGVAARSRKRALSLLDDIDVINTISRSAFIELDKSNEVKIHIIAENSSEESLAPDGMLFAELQEIVFWLKGKL